MTGGNRVKARGTGTTGASVPASSGCQSSVELKCDQTQYMCT